MSAAPALAVNLGAVYRQTRGSGPLCPFRHWRLQPRPAVVSGSLTFTSVMVRARLSVADIFHRGVVLSLIGVCVWGIGTGVLVHRDTLRMGRG